MRGEPSERDVMRAVSVNSALQLCQDRQAREALIARALADAADEALEEAAKVAETASWPSNFRMGAGIGMFKMGRKCAAAAIRTLAAPAPEASK